MTFPLSKAANQFAIDFFHNFLRRHGNKHKNLLVSPYLVFHALAMLLVGAKGRTAAQLMKLMRIPSDLATASSREQSIMDAKERESGSVSPARHHRRGLESSIDRFRSIPRARSNSSLSSQASNLSESSSSPTISPSIKCTRKNSRMNSNASCKQQLSTKKATQRKAIVADNQQVSFNSKSIKQQQASKQATVFEDEKLANIKAPSISARQRFICDPADEARHREMLMLTEQLIHGNHEIVHLASFIYLDKSVKRTETFKAILRDFYETKPKKIDFTDPNLMMKTINEDVARTTENIYSDILSRQEAQACAKTFMLLVNAVFFRGFWQSNFTSVKRQTFTKFPSKLLDNSVNSQMSFKSQSSMKSIKASLAQDANTASNNPKIFQIDMMTKLDFLPVINDKDLDARIVRLPFEASDLQMMIFLPNNNQSDSTYLCRHITAQKIESIARAFTTAEPKFSQVTMPVFCVDSGKISIQSTLVKMGAGDLFDKKDSNMTGLSETKPLWLHKILHRCFIICDNRGAITSSGTEMARKRRALLDKAAQKENIVDFTADHPFLYIILDSVTRTILLIGQYTDPSETLQLIHENQLSPEEAHQIYTEGVYKT